MSDKESLCYGTVHIITLSDIITTDIIFMLRDSAWIIMSVKIARDINVRDINVRDFQVREIYVR